MLITLSWPQRVKRVYYTITKTIQLFFCVWCSNSKLILHNNRIHRKYINILSNQSEWEAPKHCLIRFAMIQVCRWYFCVAKYAHGHLCMNSYMNGYLNIGLKLGLAKFLVDGKLTNYFNYKYIGLIWLKNVHLVTLPVIYLTFSEHRVQWIFIQYFLYFKSWLL